MSKILLLFKLSRFIPHLLIYRFHPNRKVLEQDCIQWLKVLRITHKGLLGFLYLLNSIHEYRNVFYLRLGKVKYLLNFIAPRISPNYIDTQSKDIGDGFVFQHGFSTIVNAHSIGKNCQIWHNVTVGQSKSGTLMKPTIGDNVLICAGAVVIGEVFIGDNVVIGAGAVVTKSVPPNCVVVGNPSFVIKQNGISCKKQL